MTGDRQATLRDNLDETTDTATQISLYIQQITEFQAVVEHLSDLFQYEALYQDFVSIKDLLASGSLRDQSSAQGILVTLTQDLIDQAEQLDLDATVWTQRLEGVIANFESLNYDRVHWETEYEEQQQQLNQQTGQLKNLQQTFNDTYGRFGFNFDAPIGLSYSYSSFYGIAFTVHGAKAMQAQIHNQKSIINQTQQQVNAASQNIRNINQNAIANLGGLATQIEQVVGPLLQGGLTQEIQDLPERFAVEIPGLDSYLEQQVKGIFSTLSPDEPRASSQTAITDLLQLRLKTAYLLTQSGEIIQATIQGEIEPAIPNVEVYPGTAEFLAQEINQSLQYFQRRESELQVTVTENEASIIAANSQAKWYDEQAAIHWDKSRKQGAIWTEDRGDRYTR